jgi:hypothetical protein
MHAKRLGSVPGQEARWQASAHTAQLTQIVPNRRHIDIEYLPQPIGNRKAGMRVATPSLEVMVNNFLTSQFCRQRQMAGVANGMGEGSTGVTRKCRVPGSAVGLEFPSHRFEA